MDPTTIETGRGRFLELVSRQGWEFVRRTSGRAVVAVIAITDADELVVVEQHRPPVNGRVLELPAGLVGDRGDESLEEAARRELREETGFTAAAWRRLPSVVSSAGLTDERVELFEARGLARRDPGGGIEGESIVVHLIPLARLVPWLGSRQEEGLQVDGRVFAVPGLLTWAAEETPKRTRE